MCAIEVAEEDEDELMGRAPGLDVLEQLLESEQSRANCKLKRCKTASAFGDLNRGKLPVLALN